MPPPPKNNTSSIITQPTPPTPPARSEVIVPVTDAPVYQYVNKTGPKRQVYDKDQGGIKKFKETSQSSVGLASKSEPMEPLCKGRNQMIIMGDSRILS